MVWASEVRPSNHLSIFYLGASPYLFSKPSHLLFPPHFTPYRRPLARPLTRTSPPSTSTFHPSALNARNTAGPIRPLPPSLCLPSPVTMTNGLIPATPPLYPGTFSSPRPSHHAAVFAFAIRVALSTVTPCRSSRYAEDCDATCASASRARSACRCAVASRPSWE